jgi:hypothetical protein
MRNIVDISRRRNLMSDETENDFLVVSEAAKVMRMAKRTLDNHRCKGSGPKFRRHGGRIVYRRCDLLEWSERRAARTAVSERVCASPSSPPIGRNSRRSPVTDEGQGADAALECKLKRSDRSLLSDKQGAGKRPFGSNPSA